MKTLHFERKPILALLTNPRVIGPLRFLANTGMFLARDPVDGNFDDQSAWVFASECNPNTNDDWRSVKNAFWGGDDGMVTFDHVDLILDALLRNDGDLCLNFKEEGMFFSIASRHDGT